MPSKLVYVKDRFFQLPSLSDYVTSWLTLELELDTALEVSALEDAGCIFCPTPGRGCERGRLESM